MSIIAEKPEGGNFIQVEPGTYVARCYSMIEIGTIKTEYLGKEKILKKVNITWELPTETAIFKEGNGPEPFVVSKTYTLSMFDKANLRKDLESWRGKKYEDDEAEKVDITKLLGQPCLLSVIHQAGKKDPSKNYVTISSIAKLMKGQECPDQINPMRVLSYDGFNWDVFNSLSDYMKDQIRSSDEFKQMQEPNKIKTGVDSESHPEELDEITDLPF